MVLTSCGSGHNIKYWKAGQKSLFKSSKRAKKEKENRFILKIKITDMDSSKIWGRLSRDSMTLCLQSICCLWNIACCDLERSFTQKFVFPAWGVCNLNYKLHFLCCRFLIPQSLKCRLTWKNESFSNRRGSFYQTTSLKTSQLSNTDATLDIHSAYLQGRPIVQNNCNHAIPSCHNFI